jgi:hypothetical protein
MEIVGAPRTGTGRTQHAARYRERLWPGPVGWGTVIGFATFVYIALLPAAPRAALPGAVVGLLVAVAVAVRVSVPVEVGDGVLRAGRAAIPVELVGHGRVLDRAGIRAALGPGSDARAFACLRAWIGTAVELVVQDPADPTPTWLISTRRPAALIAAIEAEQGTAQAAHSEQMG